MIINTGSILFRGSMVRGALDRNTFSKRFSEISFLNILKENNWCQSCCKRYRMDFFLRFRQLFFSETKRQAAESILQQRHHRYANRIKSVSSLRFSQRSAAQQFLPVHGPVDIREHQLLRILNRFMPPRYPFHP